MALLNRKAMTSEIPIIEAKHLSKDFELDGARLNVLHDVSISINEGRFVCLLGPSGCGKSTFLRCIAGLESPTSGTLKIDGRAINGPGPDRSMVFQDYALFPWSTVLENISFGLKLRRNHGILKDASVEEISRELVQLTGLSGFENAYPHQISGGMRQRVGLARALSVSPRVLLMDEPFAALDAITRESMQHQLVDVWTKTKKTILFVTHSVDEAAFLGDEIHVFSLRPASIMHSIEVTLPRPRAQDSTEYLRIISELKRMIQNAQKFQHFSTS
jgi:NitT/TauT family transport system ATP-binding protein